MTFRLMTMATPLQIAVFHASREMAVAKQEKATKREARKVETLLRWSADGSWFELQAAIETKSGQAKGRDFAQAHLAAKQRLELLGWKTVKARGQRRGVLTKVRSGLLETHFGGVDRAAVSGIEVIRISPMRLDAHDNLRQAFKHVIDDICIWIDLGESITARDIAGIGRYDDKLLGTGKVTCHYDQTTHETDKRLQGIRIRLHLGSKPR